MRDAGGSSIFDRPALARWYRSRPVLVAGGDGFLGRNCVMALVELGAEVSVLTRRPADDDRPAGLRHLFVGDLRDRELVAAAVQGQEIVFDFAGSSGAVDSNRDPESSLDEEGRAQLGLFAACARAHEPPQVLFCSSRLVYGRPRYLPVDEEHPLAPLSIYAANKIAAEHHLAVFARTRGLAYTVLRVSNPYGPHQGPGRKLYGVINQFLQRAARGESICVYGDGSQLRDYLFVDDLVAAFILCAAEPLCRNQCFNLGGRHAIRLGDAAETIARLASAPPVRFADWPEDYGAVETGDYLSSLAKIDRFIDLPLPVSFDRGVSSSLTAYRRAGMASYAVTDG